ncbi:MULTISPECIES: phage baseplate assembly protein [unclassified Pantoea]|uniref:phage baseplate assembly protein n=1 Tax=unclassified Pantoea TaxID=2630326 RepID=UPI001232E13B|nr:MULTISPECIES: phage tail protein [unclassified Pantoea]KAA5957741.1 phage tail protein [Pantoea sp. VH_16]KAA6104700.1 phage tail protein [Pantoea sp. Bo_14]KAA6108077.1 phage tail protein [Pantoea sp. Bo_11]
MPTQNNATAKNSRNTTKAADERLTLTVGGVTHSDWESASVDSSFLTPAGAWSLRIGLNEARPPADVHPGARAVLSAGSDILMTGLIDDINHDVTNGRHVLNLAGRDNAGALVDCSAPIFTAENMTLAEVINKIVKPSGITKIAIHADKSTAPKKFSIQPGQTAWSALMNVAEVNGLWPWIAPDGTLIIGGPDYSAAPVDSLVMRKDGTGNLLQLGKLTSIAGRYSQVTVLSQSHGTQSHNGAHNRHGTATDTGMTLYRPFIEVMGDTDTDDMATARARKILSDSRLKALTLTATVRGVRTSGGTAWQPGQRVAVRSDIHDIDAIYFIMARTIRCGRGQELVTTLTLKEDGIWTPDAYPRSRHKKKGKQQVPTYHTWEEIN